MNLNTNQAHDRPPPGAREGAGGPPQVLPPAVIPATAINPQAAAAIAALAASNDVDSAPPGGLEPHYQAYNGTPTGWAAPPPRHPQWQEPEPQQQQQQPPPTLLSSSTPSSIQVQAVSYFRPDLSFSGSSLFLTPNLNLKMDKPDLNLKHRFRVFRFSMPLFYPIPVSNA